MVFQHRSLVSCSTTHPGKIALPRGGQESPEQSWAPAEKEHEACRLSTISTFLPVGWSWRWKRILGYSGQNKQASNQVRRRLIKQMISILFQVSTLEFRVVKLIRWRAIARAIVCGSRWDSCDYFFFSISHFISFSPLSDSVSHCNCLLPTLFAVLSSGSWD